MYLTFVSYWEQGNSSTELKMGTESVDKSEAEIWAGGLFGHIFKSPIQLWSPAE